MPVFRVKPFDRKENQARHFATCIGDLDLSEWKLHISEPAWFVIKTNARSHLATRFRQLKRVAEVHETEV